MSPAIPPPTTTTRRVIVVADAATMRRARAAITPRSSLTTDVRRKSSPRGVGTSARLDVEVVEHLEVVGDEAARAHQHAVDVAGSGQRVDHAEQVRLEPWFRRRVRPTARRSTSDPAASPARSATSVAVAATSAGYGSPLSRIRRGSEWAVNSTFVPAGIAGASRAATTAGEEVDVRRLGRPAARSPTNGMPCAAAAAAGALEVDADGHRRVVRGEHEADDVVDAALGEHVDGLLDARFGVAQPDGDGELAGRAFSSAAAITERCASVRSAQRAEPADRVVAARSRSASCSSLGGRPRRMSV